MLLQRLFLAKASITYVLDHRSRSTPIIGKAFLRTKGDPSFFTLYSQGHWLYHPHAPCNFYNIYRFRQNHLGQLQIDHLRHGSNHPVELFTLQPYTGGIYKSVTDHECSQDTYSCML